MDFWTVVQVFAVVGAYTIADTLWHVIAKLLRPSEYGTVVKGPTK